MRTPLFGSYICSSAGDASSCIAFENGERAHEESVALSHRQAPPHHDAHDIHPNDDFLDEDIMLADAATPDGAVGDVSPLGDDDHDDGSPPSPTADRLAAPLPPLTETPTSEGATSTLSSPLPCVPDAPSLPSKTVIALCCLTTIHNGTGTVARCNKRIVLVDKEGIRNKYARRVTVLYGRWYLADLGGEPSDPANMYVCTSHFMRDRNLHRKKWGGTPAGPVEKAGKRLVHMQRFRCGACGKLFRTVAPVATPVIRHQLPSGRVIMATWDLVKCKQWKSDGTARGGRAVCQACMHEAGAPLWRSNQKRGYKPHRCTVKCRQVPVVKGQPVCRLDALFDMAATRSADRKQRDWNREKAKEDEKKMFFEVGTKLATTIRNDGGAAEAAALSTFLDGFFDAAATLVTRDRERSSDYARSAHMRRLFMGQLLTRTVRPLSDMADILDDLTAMASLPGAHATLVDVLRFLGVLSAGDTHIKRLRHEIAEKVQKEYVPILSLYGCRGQMA